MSAAAGAPAPAILPLHAVDDAVPAGTPRHSPPPVAADNLPFAALAVVVHAAAAAAVAAAVRSTQDEKVPRLLVELRGQH